jgi:hypothetical protein
LFGRVEKEKHVPLSEAQLKIAQSIAKKEVKAAEPAKKAEAKPKAQQMFSFGLGLAKGARTEILAPTKREKSLYDPSLNFPMTVPYWAKKRRVME